MDQPLKDRVTCYSGSTYAERPISFAWEGERLMVERIEARWQTPGIKHFRVAADGGRHFELQYHATEDAWRVIPL